MGFPSAPQSTPEPRMRAQLDGGGEGTASLVCGVLVFPSMLLTSVPAGLAALFTIPDTGSNGLEWVWVVVLLSVPTLFGLLSALFGVLALRRNERNTTAWSTGVAGLCLTGTEAVVLSPLALGAVVNALY